MQLGVEVAKARGSAFTDKRVAFKLKFGSERYKSRPSAPVAEGEAAEWNERFVFGFKRYSDSLRVTACLDTKKLLGRSEKLGTAEVDISSLENVQQKEDGSRAMEMWSPILHAKTKEPTGEVLLLLSVFRKASRNSAAPSAYDALTVTHSRSPSLSAASQGEAVPQRTVVPEAPPSPKTKPVAPLFPLPPLSSIVHEGWLERRTSARHRYHNRYFVLYQEKLLAYFRRKPPKTEEMDSMDRSVIDISELVSLRRIASTHHHFVLELEFKDFQDGSKKSTLLAQTDKEQQAGWVDSIRSLMPRIIVDETHPAATRHAPTDTLPPIVPPPMSPTPERPDGKRMRYPPSSSIAQSPFSASMYLPGLHVLLLPVLLYFAYVGWGIHGLVCVVLPWMHSFFGVIGTGPLFRHLAASPWQVLKGTIEVGCLLAVWPWISSTYATSQEYEAHFLASAVTLRLAMHMILLKHK